MLCTAHACGLGRSLHARRCAMPSQRHFALLSPHETRPHSEVGWAISIGLACVAATALLLLLWVGGQALLLKLDQRERIKAEARAAGLTPAQVAMLDAGRCGRR